jgi:hypothetical protein
VPIDEIQRSMIELRSQTLFYSTAFLVFVLPLYVTLMLAWIDRRLGTHGRWSTEHEVVHGQRSLQRLR